MAVIHITEAEAAQNFTSVMNSVRAGEEVRIDNGAMTVAIVRAPDISPNRRTLSEAIRLAEQRDLQTTLDDQFGRDLNDIIRGREHETLPNLWE